MKSVHPSKVRSVAHCTGVELEIWNDRKHKALIINNDIHMDPRKEREMGTQGYSISKLSACVCVFE